MNKIAFVFAFVSTSAFAQTPPSPEMTQAVIGSLQTQRNTAEDQAAGLAAQLQVTQKQLETAQKKISELEAKLPKPDVKPDPAPAK